MPWLPPVRIEYPAPGSRRKPRRMSRGCVIEFELDPVLHTESDRESMLNFMWGIVRAIGSGARVGETDDSVCLYIIDRPGRPAEDVLAALAHRIREIVA